MINLRNKLLSFSTVRFSAVRLRNSEALGNGVGSLDQPQFLDPPVIEIFAMVARPVGL